MKAHRRRSAHHEIEIAERDGVLSFYLDGMLQLSSLDERRYHRALVHPAMSAAGADPSVLILGGGDGCAARECLALGARAITLVDIDADVVALARDHAGLAALNQRSLSDPRVTVLIEDADARIPLLPPASFNAIVVDLPDAVTAPVQRLTASSGLRRLLPLLRDDGCLSSHLGGVFRQPDVFRRQSAEFTEAAVSAGKIHRLYAIEIPSFGAWGFGIASARPPDLASIGHPIVAIDRAP